MTALSSGVRSAQGKVPGSLYGVGTDITVTTATRPASGLGQITPEPYVQHSDVLGSPRPGPAGGVRRRRPSPGCPTSAPPPGD